MGRLRRIVLATLLIATTLIPFKFISAQSDQNITTVEGIIKETKLTVGGTYTFYTYELIDPDDVHIKYGLIKEAGGTLMTEKLDIGPGKRYRVTGVLGSNTYDLLIKKISKMSD